MQAREIAEAKDATTSESVIPPGGRRSGDSNGEDDGEGYVDSSIPYEAKNDVKDSAVASIEAPPTGAILPPEQAPTVSVATSSAALGSREEGSVDITDLTQQPGRGSRDHFTSSRDPREQITLPLLREEDSRPIREAEQAPNIEADSPPENSDSSGEGEVVNIQNVQKYYVYAPVYQKYDIMNTEVKDSKIEKIGAPTDPTPQIPDQLLRVRGAEDRPALEWPETEGAVGRSPNIPNKRQRERANRGDRELVALRRHEQARESETVQRTPVETRLSPATSPGQNTASSTQATPADRPTVEPRHADPPILPSQGARRKHTSSKQREEPEPTEEEQKSSSPFIDHEETTPKTIGGLKSNMLSQPRRQRQSMSRQDLRRHDRTTNTMKGDLSSHNDPAKIDDAFYDNESVSERQMSFAERDEGRSRHTSVQTLPPPTFDTESQTTEKITRDRMLQTENERTYDTEVQTDRQDTRERKCQTDMMRSADNETQAKLFNSLDKSSQTTVKTYVDTDIQTDGHETDDVSSQTSIRTTSDIALQNNLMTKQSVHAEMFTEAAEEFALEKTGDESSELKWINVYESEEATIPIEKREKYKDPPSLLEQTWTTIRRNSVVNAFERHLAGINNPNVLERTAIRCYKMAKEELNDTEDLEYLRAYTSCADDVFNMGEDFASDEHFIHAVIAFYLSAKLHKLINKGDKSVRDIKSCVFKVKNVVESMRKQEAMKKVALDHVIPLMREMISFLRSIQSSTHDVIIEIEVWCLLYIGVCYFYCGEFQEFAEVNESAIDLMKREFKEKAEKYPVYGRCLNNAGVAYARMGNIEKAVEKYRMALNVYNKATWEDEKVKTEKIKLTKNNLRRASAKLPN